MAILVQPMQPPLEQPLKGCPTGPFYVTLVESTLFDGIPKGTTLIDTVALELYGTLVENVAQDVAWGNVLMGYHEVEVHRSSQVGYGGQHKYNGAQTQCCKHSKNERFQT